MNCGFDSFEPDTYLVFFGKVMCYISLSMSGSTAGSITSAKNFTGFKQKIHSNFTDVIANTQLHHV